ncbi:MAG TPA: LptF/LptG family permease [Verrucomicrobiae bacterium]|nr:LptF/LptG family permease [Verrucomicrobiae bacterium]
MKTLHLYLTREILIALLMTAAVFTFVLLLGNVLKEIIALLIARQISMGLVLKAIGLLLPYAMIYVLPFGMITAVLLVFGRFSADQELTAVRASGVSLLALAAPIVWLSLVLCGVCAVFNLWISPRCRAAYKALIFEVGSRNISNLITEDRFIDEIPGIVLYVRKKFGDEIEDVRLYNLEDNRIKARTIAKRGLIKLDPTALKIGFALFDAVSELRREPKPIDENFIGPPEPPDPTQWQQIHYAELEPDPIDLAPLVKSEHKPKISEMDFWHLRQELRELQEKGISAMPVRVQMHRQVAFSFACFAFTLLAIPLAIQAHRRETSIGVAIALGLVMLYYAFNIAAQAIETREYLKPHLIVWLPNFLFQGLGGFLIYRANRR